MKTEPEITIILTPDIPLLPETPPVTAPAVVAPSLDMVGEWESIAERRLDLVARVTTVKGKKKRREEVTEYRISTMRMCPNRDAVACWTFDKQEPDVKRHVVLLHRDGSLTCDCEFGTYKKPDDPTLCAHASVALTIADAFKPLVLPDQVVVRDATSDRSTVGPAQPCFYCAGRGRIDDPFSDGGTITCPRCQQRHD